MASKGNKQNVRVFCRIRPTNQKEIDSGGYTCVNYTNNSIEVATEEGTNMFTLDRVFGDDVTQVDVFHESATSLIGDVLSGYNATIFAYGQTGTGKTHTMEGDIHSEEGKGIIPRAVEALFEGVLEADENIEFTFKVSYVEIYLEKIRDLLDDHRIKTNLTVREDKVKGIYIAGVTEEYVTSVEELLHIMHIGAKNRAVAATGMNEGSSRSHSVFTITVSQKDVITSATKSGKLVLVDLAGSEMVRKSNASGQQLEEAKMINKSLSALGQVINALTDDKTTHVPYRDSKLTRVLQDSLGGNSKTALIVAVSPSSFNAPETVSTLRFGYRAKRIENKVTINQTRSIEELESLLVRAEKAIDAQTAHIISLSTQLQAMQSVAHQHHQEGEEAVEAQQEQNEAVPGEDDKRTLVDMEGKVLLDIAKVEEEAAAMARLQDTVQQLTQELDEERQESSRKDLEIKQMNVLLKEKERLMAEAATMLADVQRSSESLRERSEQLLREKVDAIGDAESLRAQLEEAEAKSKYEADEMEVTLNTLRTENQQLKQEIAEMSGEGSVRRGGNGAPSTPGSGRKNAISSDMGEAGDVETTSRRTTIATASSKQPAVSDDSEKTLSAKERRALLEVYAAQFQAACMHAEIDEQKSAALYAVMEEYAAKQERYFVAVEEKMALSEKMSSKRSKDLQEHRSRLEKDLQNRIENMIQLQVKFDSLSRMDSKQMQDTLAEKDRAQMRSLQQRLEQLVAVHRQLLRKFASLELENGELKKKTQLRDERIKQLEGNSRGLIGNIRQQAERHVSELTKLREQIQNMKAEHELRLENIQHQTTQGGIGATPRRAGGGGGGPKSLRGGGGAMSRSFYDRESSKSHANNPPGHDPLASLPELDFPAPPPSVRDGKVVAGGGYDHGAPVKSNGNGLSIDPSAPMDKQQKRGSTILGGPPIVPSSPGAGPAASKSSVFSRMLNKK